MIELAIAVGVVAAWAWFVREMRKPRASDVVVTWQMAAARLALMNERIRQTAAAMGVTFAEAAAAIERALAAYRQNVRETRRAGR